MTKDNIAAQLAALQRRRKRNEAALDRTMSETRDVVKAGAELGLSESELHRLAGVNRTTIRNWLGKPTRSASTAEER